MSRNYTHLTVGDYAQFAHAGLIVSTRFFVPSIRTSVNVDAGNGYICLTGIGCKATEDFSGIRKVIQEYFDAEILEQPQQVDDCVSCLIRAKGANVSKVSDFIMAVKDGFSKIVGLDIKYEGVEPPENLLSKSFSEKACVFWKNLEIQRNVGGPKERYEWGLDYIHQNGFERYLELTEQFELVFDIFEGRVPEEFYKIFFQERGSYEWSQSAWEVTPDENVLISYKGVTGLRFQEYTRPDHTCGVFYLTPDFKYTEKREFPIGHLKDKAHEEVVNGKVYQIGEPLLKDFDDDFVLWHCGRVLKDFPEQMKQARIDVDLLDFGWSDPEHNRCIVPIAFDNMYDQHKFILFGHVGGAGSARGAREIKAY